MLPTAHVSRLGGRTGDSDTLGRMRRDGAEAWAALAVSVLATGAAAWFIFDLQQVAAGWSVAVATVAMTSASVRSHDDVSRFLGAVLYRVFDAVILGLLAWQLRPDDPALAAAALFALVGGFLAAYFAARGRSLGYSIDASTLNRFLRMGLVALALLTGEPAWLWACAALSMATAIVRGSQAFKEEMV